MEASISATEGLSLECRPASTDSAFSSQTPRTASAQRAPNLSRMNGSDRGFPQHGCPALQHRTAIRSLHACDGVRRPGTTLTLAPRMWAGTPSRPMGPAIATAGGGSAATSGAAGYLVMPLRMTSGPIHQHRQRLHVVLMQGWQWGASSSITGRQLLHHEGPSPPASAANSLLCATALKPAGTAFLHLNTASQ